MAKIVTLLSRKGTALFRTILLTSVIAIVAGSVISLASQQDRALEKAISDYISVASSQYNQGLYETAKDSLNAAKNEYGSIFTDEQSERIEQLLRNVNDAIENRKAAEQRLVKGIGAADAGNYRKALDIFSQVRADRFASDAQKQEAQVRSREVEARVSEIDSQMRQLFSDSYQLYQAGDLEQAKAGFEKVHASGVRARRGLLGRDSAYYINQIQQQLAAQELEAKKIEQAQAKAQEAELKVDVVKVENTEKPVDTVDKAVKKDVEVIEAKQAVEKSPEDSYIRVIQERTDRQRNYTNAIVNDSIQKANEAVARGDYPAARSALSVAYANVEKTKQLLGDELYTRYTSMLDELSSQIDDAHARADAERERVRRIETQQLQDQIRSDVETQRQRAVKDYLNNAMEFQREQRYDEALTQLNALLAIDPLNSVALLQKQTLEDTILWREQLRIQREKHREEIKTLLSSDRASIPYSDEMTFPRNWKDIVEKRKAIDDTRFAPEDLTVYRALDQVVDLTSFHEDMTFREAIDILSNAMEPSITIVVLWSDLDMNAFVDRNTPINLTIPAPVRARVGLNLLLSSVAGGLAEISYVVTDGIIRIATAESLPDRMVVRRYDVTDLLGATAAYSFDMDTTDYGGQGGGRSAGGGGGGQQTQRTQRQDDDQRRDPEQIRQEAMGRAGAIIQLIQETIDPFSWYDAGGDASLTTYSTNTLVIRQTVDNHEKIRELLDELRSSLGEQVAIEARFITVTENFLEEIGLDLDVFIGSPGSNWNDFIFEQTHADGARTTSTGVPGNLSGSMASTFSGGYILDDLQVNFILNATQAHKDAQSLNAPKVTVLSGESAGIRVEREFTYVGDYQFEDTTQAGDMQPIRTIADPEIMVIRDGVILNVAPTITADKKYVLLDIRTSYTQTEFETYEIPATGGAGGANDRLYTIQLPVSQIADVRTRVTVPDSGTLLIGGQKLTGEITTSKGVPVLSKLPFVGRLFENTGRAKDNSVLLILVKPTIILQDEQEREAVAAMESRF